MPTYPINSIQQGYDASGGEASSNSFKERDAYCYSYDGCDGRDRKEGPSRPPDETGPQGFAVTGNGGVVFTVWGKSKCPTTEGTQLVYDGLAGKTSRSDTGGGIDYQCLSKQPKYLALKSGTQGMRAYMTGVEYEHMNGGQLSTAQFRGVPCAVCYTSSRGAVLMIPGRYQCPSSWTTEYYGYLTAERHSHTNPSTHACVHKDMEPLPGTSANTHEEGFMMHVETKCTTHICPPYKSGEALTCAVCSK